MFLSADVTINANEQDLDEGVLGFIPALIRKALDTMSKGKVYKEPLAVYYKMLAKGVKEGVALHKAASLYGFSDRELGDVIRQLKTA